jgi:hypothetical protein
MQALTCSHTAQALVEALLVKLLSNLRKDGNNSSALGGQYLWDRLGYIKLRNLRSKQIVMLW